jgi:FkbM family methyltransferase
LQSASGANGGGASGVSASPAVIEVRVRGVDGGERVIRMADAGGASRWRAQTLLTKEPETIAWLDRVRPGEVVWDVGANVGCYTLYAAVARGARVVAFEPGAANYAALNENVRLSGVGDRVTALCVALAERTGLAPLHMRFVEPGGACAAFGDARDEAGRAFTPVFSQGTLGMSVDDLLALRGVEAPDHIKLDVDGLEEAILRGATSTLREGRVKSLSVEIDDAGAGSVERIAALLREAGFVHAGKFQGQQGPESRGSTIFNHHFVRPSALVGGASAASGANGGGALLMAGAPNAPATTSVTAAGTAAAGTVGEASTAPTIDARFDEDPVEHVRYVLRNAERSDWPFTHLVADGVFPAWYYRELLRLFPAPGDFTPLNAAHPTRGSLMLTPKAETGRPELDRLRGEQRAFWEEFTRRFATREVCREMLLAMGGPPLLERFGERCEPLVHLAYDGLGYAIHPHCDVDRKVVTMIFYLPPDDAAAAYGTSVLVERADAAHLSPESWERYRVAKTVAFVPNRCFGFLVGGKSWHGVRPVERPTPRRSVQFFVTMPG